MHLLFQRRLGLKEKGIKNLLSLQKLNSIERAKEIARTKGSEVIIYHKNTKANNGRLYDSQLHTNKTQI